MKCQPKLKQKNRLKKGDMGPAQLSNVTCNMIPNASIIKRPSSSKTSWSEKQCSLDNNDLLTDSQHQLPKLKCQPKSSQKNKLIKEDQEFQGPSRLPDATNHMISNALIIEDPNSLQSSLQNSGSNINYTSAYPHHQLPEIQSTKNEMIGPIQANLLTNVCTII